MNALFLSDLRKKTHRGLVGKVENGLSGGGKCYGYDVVKGEERGHRTINQQQAAVVRRIFEDYSAGKSPKAIALALNNEGIPGPTGKAWGQSTINLPKVRRRNTNPIKDQQSLGRVLSTLGQSRLSSNLNQMARAVNTGTLPVHPETEAELRQACADVSAMRAALLDALGKNGGAS